MRGPCACPPCLFASQRTSTRPPPIRSTAPCPYTHFQYVRMVAAFNRQCVSFAHLLSFLFLENTTQDFPGRISGNGINVFDLVHILVGGELAVGPCDQFTL